MLPSDSQLNNHDMSRPLNSPAIEMDVFPPLRSRVSDPSAFVPYAEDLGYEEDYEDYLLDLNDDPNAVIEPPFPGFWSQEGSAAGLANAWRRVEDLAGGLADDISDSESIVSIGELGEEVRNDGSSSGSEAGDSNVNNWEVRSFSKTEHYVFLIPPS